MKDDIDINIEHAHAHFAKATNDRTWELISKDDRTEAEDFEMQAAAFSSIYHWAQIGTALHLQRGERLIARVFSSLGNGDAALKHAIRCYELMQANLGLMQDFDIAYGYEGIARANSLIGNVEEAKPYYEKAREAGKAIVDEQDRGIFMADIESGAWFGIT